MKVSVWKICLAVLHLCCPQSCLDLSTCRSSETCPVDGLMSRDSIWSDHYDTPSWEGWVKNISFCKLWRKKKKWRKSFFFFFLTRACVAPTLVCFMRTYVDQRIWAEKRINMATFKWLSMEKHANMLTSQTLTLCLELNVIPCSKRHAL